MIESIFNRENPRDARRRRIEEVANVLNVLISAPVAVCIFWILNLWQPELPWYLRGVIIGLVSSLPSLAAKRLLRHAHPDPRDGLGPEVR